MSLKFYQAIKENRLKNKLSQEYLSEQLEMSRPTYMQIEKGERELTISEAKKLASIFSMNLEDFLAGNEAPEVKVNFAKKKIDNKTKKEKSVEMRISVPQEDKDKFKAVLTYVLKRVGGKPNVGMTVLYKLLYFIDFDYYERYEEQLTGAAYMRNHFGPTPVMFTKLVKEMENKNEIEIVSSKFYKKDQKKFFVNPEYEPDISKLSSREIKHIDTELKRLSDKNATELSNLSHKDVPWITAKEGGQIDYESVFYRTDDTSVRIYG